MSEEKVFPGRRSSPLLEKVADRVWLLRGDIKHGMNVYFIEEEGGGVVQFDAGTEPMTKAVNEVGERLGGINRIVLGHSHTDHRGSAPGIGAPVYCHPDEVKYAERDDWRQAADYWDMSKLEVAWVRWLYPRLHNRWDAGAVKITDTVVEGDEIAGFKVHHFPGHAPGLIGLFRESDRLALVTDAVYLVDAARLKALPEGKATVPHPAFNWDTTKARESLLKLADLDAATVCTGHEHPLTENVRATLEAAAAKN